MKRGFWQVILFAALVSVVVLVWQKYVATQFSPPPVSAATRFDDRATMPVPVSPPTRLVPCVGVTNGTPCIAPATPPRRAN